MAKKEKESIQEDKSFDRLETVSHIDVFETLQPSPTNSLYDSVDCAKQRGQLPVL